MTVYRKREVGVLLARALRQAPVVVVSGLRQSGKSTLLREDPAVRAGRAYRTLDDLNLLAGAQAAPRQFLESEPVMALDEVQRLPSLFLPLKQTVDEDRRPGRFVLTGSANLLLLKSAADSLAGRAVYATLHPMNRREIAGMVDHVPAVVRFLADGRWPATKGLPPVTGKEILRGGFPEVALRPEIDAALWFEGFERTYLERDVRDLRQVADLVSFRRLLRLAALRVGGVLNVNGLARDAQLPEATVRSHLNLLETLMVIRRLAPFRGNRSTRLIKAPKLYLADTGLAAFLAGVPDIGPESAEPLRGALVENYVVQNLMSTLEPHLTGVQFFYWHEQGRHEVDLVIEHGRKVLAIEIKAGGRVTPDDARALDAFMTRTPNCVGGVVTYFGREIVPLGEKRWAVPLPLLLS